jgi:transcriptional regulator with XRE-family HTH domain
MTQINKDAIAHNMKLIRSLTGMSMNEFGKKIGDISKDQVASYENGRALPQEPTIIRVCELAGITRQDFVTKSITKEEIVKEMFVVLNQTTADTTGGDRASEELRKVIDALQQTISAQKMVIEMQSKMMEQFSALVKR